MINIIIAGGRTFNNQDVCDRACDKVLGSIIDDIGVFCGDAKGADSCGDLWAYIRGVYVTYFPAKWKDLNLKPCHVKENAYGFYNVLAGTNRNKEMGDQAQGLILFWDGKSSGSKHMLSYAKKLGLSIMVFDYEGNILEDLWHIGKEA